MMNILPYLKQIESPEKQNLFSRKIFEMLPVIDDCLEEAMESHLGFQLTVTSMLEHFNLFSQVRTSWIITRDQYLETQLYLVGDSSLSTDESHYIETLKKQDIGPSEFYAEECPAGCTAIPIVVNRKLLGYFGFFPQSQLQLPESSDFTANEQDIFLKCLSTVFIELFDNYLFTFNIARIKHFAEKNLSTALANRNFTEAILGACKILHQHVDFQELVLFFHDQDDTDINQLNYFVLQPGDKIYDPFRYYDQDMHRFMEENGRLLLKNQEHAIYDYLSSKKWRKEVLIDGIVHSKTVGAVIIGSVTSDFNRFESDLLEIFVSFIRQRVMDYNKDWYILATYFSISNRSRLLDIPNFVEKHLHPQKQTIAMLYADVSGFTMLCEQVFESPETITQFVEIWSRRCIAALWQNGGTLDKLAGDCVVGLFGPPFFDGSIEESCLNAVNAAVAIRKITESIMERGETCFQEIRRHRPGFNLGCSIGIGFGEVCVGFVGQNKDYTCFGTAMNNTARIQGAANQGQILAFDAFHSLSLPGCKFGNRESLNLKNVKGEFIVRELLESPVKK